MKNKILFQGLAFSLNIGITLLLLLFVMISWENKGFDNWESIVSLLSIYLLIMQMMTFYIYEITIYDFKFWFILLSHIFLFGQIYVLAIGDSDKIFYNVIERYPSRLIMQSGLFSLCYIQFIFMGILFYQNKKRHLKLSLINKKFTNSDPRTDYLMKLTGIILFIVSFPLKLFNDIKIISRTQMLSSYTAFTTTSNIYDDISYLVVPSGIFIICGLKNSSKKQKVVLLSFITYFVLFMILTGDRRYSVTGILSIVLAYLFTNRQKIKLRQIIIFAISSAVLLNLLAIIRDIRLGSLTTLSNFIREYGTSLFEMNPILETLSEFGVTILTVAFSIKDIPSQIPFQYGLSFYGAIPSILPIGWLFDDFFRKVSIFNTLDSMEGYPVGSSLPGELYANFGWWSLLVALLFGYILSIIFDRNSIRSSNIYVGSYYSLFYILINLVRSSFIEILRNSIIVSVIPLLIMLILYEYQSKKNKC